MKRTKLTFIGAEPDYTLSYARYRVEAGATLAGMSFCCAWFHHQGTMLPTPYNEFARTQYRKD